MSIVEIERDTTKTYSGLVAPADWHIVQTWGDGLIWERTTGQRIIVIEDITVKADGKQWLHVSVSKPNKKIPTYEDLQMARTLFIGDRECYQVFPTADRYVNIANVLHLYCCMEQPEGVLPHFDGVINGVTTI
jgi:hypothetical protein